MTGRNKWPARLSRGMADARGGHTVHVVGGSDPAGLAAEKFLRSAGFPVETHSSSIAFLEALPSERSAACIVTALRLPGLDGLDLLRCLQVRGIGLPVIVMADGTDASAAIQAREAGAAGFVAEPFGAAALLAAVQRALAAPQDLDAGARVPPGHRAGPAETEGRLGPASREHELPPGLDAPARAAWATAHAIAVAHGLWQPRLRGALEALARAASEHVRDPCDDDLRLLVRTEMARWQLVPVTRIHLGLLRRDGVDADVGRLCGLSPERRARRT